MPQKHEGALNARGMRIGIVVSRWNEFITRPMLDGALEMLHRLGAEDDKISIAWVPGSVELPITVQAMAKNGKYNAIVALGCIIRGATDHHEHVAASAVTGITRVMLDTGVPIGFGVLTVDSIEQAIERAGSKAGNKGSEAAQTAVEMANLLHELHDEGAGV